MPDFTSINLKFNNNTDASPTWTGAAISFNTANNEVRWCATGAGGTSIASASWPLFTRPSSSTATVGEMWAYTADTTGLQVKTYGGTNGNANANVLKWDWDAIGTMVAAPQFSMFGDTTHVAPANNGGSPPQLLGTQPPASHNDPITNGANPDTGTSPNITSYMKYNAWGTFQTANLSAGTVGTAPSATTGNQGTLGVNTCTASNWLNTAGSWQDAAGWVHYIIAASTPAATTANSWFWTCYLFTGVTMTTGTLVPVFTMQYTYS